MIVGDGVHHCTRQTLLPILRGNYKVDDTHLVSRKVIKRVSRDLLLM
jgi:hypothetical protein